MDYGFTPDNEGYKRRNIKIEINADATWIIISGEKPVQETVMTGGRVYKKEIVMRTFKKAFKIPKEVVMDKVKAKFNEEESTLTISMPKLSKGVLGFKLEEIKEDEVPQGSSQSKQIAVDETKEIQGIDRAAEHSPAKSEEEGGRNFEELPPEKVEENLKKENEDKEIKATVEKFDQDTNNRFPLTGRKIGEKEKEITETGHDGEQELEKKCDQQFVQTESSSPKEAINQDQEVHEKKEINGTENDNQEDDESSAHEGANVEHGEKEKEKENPNPKKSKLCGPLFAGSAILVSLIVLVVHLIRTKKQTSNAKAKKQNKE